MLKSTKANAIVVFITLFLGGAIYFMISNDLFHMFASSLEQKTQNLFAIYCTASYYLGLFIMLMVYKIFPDYK